MGRKQSLRERYSRLSLWNRIQFWAAIVGFVTVFVGGMGAALKWLRSNADAPVNYTLVYSPPNALPEAQRDVQVLKSKIIDARKGYMHVRVSKEFLNRAFDAPVTLRYESGRYEPVAVTFRNDPSKGAGLIITSPEREKSASIFLNECIRFSGFGAQTYTEDLVFSLYYTESRTPDIGL